MNLVKLQKILKRGGYGFRKAHLVDCVLCIWSFINTDIKGGLICQVSFIERDGIFISSYHSTHIHDIDMVTVKLTDKRGNESEKLYLKYTECIEYLNKGGYFNAQYLRERNLSQIL